MFIYSCRFRDIGYQHSVFSNCPDAPNCHGCRPNKLAPLTLWLNKEDCRVNWFRQVCASRRRNGIDDDDGLCQEYMTGDNYGMDMI